MKVANTEERPAPDSPDGSMTLLRVPRVRRAVRAEEIEYRLLNPRGPASAPLSAAYAVWHEVWLSTLRELDGLKQLGSDEFTRQDEVGVIMHGEECVSVTGIRWLDLSQRMFMEDSYFSTWPSHCLDALRGRAVGVSSNTVLALDWRGGRIEPTSDSAIPMAIKEATISLSLRRFMDSSAELFVGVARNNRSMERVANDLGGRRIGQIRLHGEDSDIMCWSRKDLLDLGPTVENLWSRGRRA